MIADPVGDYGLTFFVTEAGECVFLALSQQMTSATHSWIGSVIDYTAQSDLERRFTPLMREMGAWLHSHGYYGPCGADILETASPGHDEDTNLYIVDLNVRTSASHILGLMRGHFSVQRGLHTASLTNITVTMTRQAFIQMFLNEFQEGRVVIVSWYEDVEKGRSSGTVVLGGRDKGELEALVGRITEAVVDE